MSENITREHTNQRHDMNIGCPAAIQPDIRPGSSNQETEEKKN